MKYITSSSLPDQEYNGALHQFYDVVLANKVVLNVNQLQLDALLALVDNYSSNLAASDAAQASARSAVIAKNEQKKLAQKAVNQFAKTFRANANVSDSLLSDLLLAPHQNPGVHSAPTQPTNLAAKSDALGNVTIKWRRGANNSRTVFIVECRNAPNGPWSLVSSTTNTKVTTTAKVGEYTEYRVTASRRGQISPASAPYTLWPSGGPSFLQVAA